MQVGNFVGPGAALMAVVPIDRVYIEAYFRERSDTLIGLPWGQAMIVKQGA